MSKVVFGFVLLLNTLNVFAVGSEGGHHASVADLIFPFINVALLFGFLFYKLKTPVKNMFNEKSEQIKELAELASEKDRKAEQELKSIEAKMNNVREEMKKILASAEEDALRFDKNQEEETRGQIERLKQDTEVKLMSEKAELIRDINSSLLDQVISGAKNKIKSDAGLQQKATSNLMSRF